MKSSDQVVGTQPLSRRRLLASAATAAAASLMPQWAIAEGAVADLAADPRRPQFHLLPAKNWMNDPNGPGVLQREVPHVLPVQPVGRAVWGDMSWYHSESPDMLHWKQLPLAFTPTPGSPDAYGCFSGSAITVGKRIYQVYTGTKLSSKELATIRDGEDKIQESQCIAWSDDPALVKWTKLPEPIIPLPPPGMKITGFSRSFSVEAGRLVLHDGGLGRG